MPTQPSARPSLRTSGAAQRKDAVPAKAQRARAAEPRPLKVLVASHSHPRLTKGGAEISAYALYQGLQRQPDTTAWFLGCANGNSEPRAGICISQPFDAAEFVYRPSGDVDYFQSANRDPEFPRALETLISELRPDIVHAHHYAVLGLETFRRIKEARPQTRIVLTLHEYIAICHNHGQMVKKQTNRLCRQESYIDCHACFPDIPAQDFFLRKKYYQHFFAYVDRFIAPSQFLAQRYIAWGIPASKMVVMENVLPGEAGPATRVTKGSAPNKTTGKQKLRLGFFGQMSPLKGIKLLAQAARLLHDRGIHEVLFDVFGDYSNQPRDFQEDVENVLNDKDLATSFHYHGPYDNEDVLGLMRSVDIVVVPSIWWENSPVVIQEAFASRRPVICSDIGGMAEKVRPGVDGWHFRAGDANSLATLLEDLLNDLKTVRAVQKSVMVPPSPAERLREHIRLYTAIRSPEP